MAAYLLVEAKVHDAVAYDAYRTLAALAVAKYKGRYLARGGDVDVLEGAWSKPERLVIIEFDSLAQAQAFYNSSEYLVAREARKEAAEMNILVVQGLPLLSD